MILLLLASALAAPRSYPLDPSQGLLYVQVYKDRRAPGASLAHDHLVRSLAFAGTVTWDPQDPQACRVEVRVPVADLVLDPPELRAQAGLIQDIGEAARASSDRNMRGAQQLDAQHFPEIRFEATACHAQADGVRVEGDMTLRGVRQAVSLPMGIAVDGDRLRASGTLRIALSRFGIVPFSAPLGLIRLLDEVDVHIDLVGLAEN